MRDDPRVRTTLDLDDDILQAAKELARASGTTAGQVISDLARRALQRREDSSSIRNDVPLLSRLPGQRRVTMAAVNELRDE